MKCSQLIKSYLSILVALLFTPHPKVLAQSSSPANICELELGKVYTIDENKPRKVMIAKNDAIEGSNIAQAASYNEATQTTSRQRLLSVQPIVRKSFAGSLQGIWQMRVNQADLQFVKAKYTVVSTDGKEGSPFNKAEIIPLNIEEARTCPGNTVVVQSGAILRFFELLEIAAGSYDARVNVCVSTKDRSC